MDFVVDNDTTPLELTVDSKEIESVECLFFSAVLSSNDDIIDRAGFKFTIDPLSTICEKEHKKHDERHRGEGKGLRSIAKELPGFTATISLIGLVGAAAFVVNKRKLD